MKNRDISTAVALYPNLTEDGAWGGEMDVVIEYSNMDGLDVEVVDQLEMFTGMVAACVDLMGQDPQLMLRVQDHYLSKVEKMEADEEAAKHEAILKSKGKVVQLRPNTKTFGNA